MHLGGWTFLSACPIDDACTPNPTGKKKRQRSDCQKIERHGEERGASPRFYTAECLIGSARIAAFDERDWNCALDTECHGIDGMTFVYKSKGEKHFLWVPQKEYDTTTMHTHSILCSQLAVQNQGLYTLLYRIFM